MSFLPFAVAAWLFVAGLYGVISSDNLVRTIVSLTVVQSSTYVLLLGVGYVKGGKAAIFADIPQVSSAVDPVVQVLVLTDIVIEATVTGLLLALAVQAHKRFGSLDPNDLRALRD
ncbi:MAG: dehydrogenase [Actinobacteria bacterium]|nr:MAG: dehydrogenase [Actinomycetota bacterium]